MYKTPVSKKDFMEPLVLPPAVVKPGRVREYQTISNEMTYVKRRLDMDAVANDIKK